MRQKPTVTIWSLSKLMVIFVLLFGVNTNLFSQEEKPVLTIQELFGTGKFFARGFQAGQWSDAGPIVTYIKRDDSTRVTNIMSYNLEDDETSIILDGEKLFAADVDKKIDIQGYEYDERMSKVLIYTDSAPVWRRNTKGFYYIFDVEDETLKPIGTREAGYQLFAKLSPDGEKVAFVRERNLFVIDIETMEETQLTFDGSEGAIINGTTDWVYEEEYGLRDGWAWSPDSKYIAFLQFDESEVSEFVMIDNREMKPELIKFKYPLAGEKNSDIRMGVIDINSSDIKYFETGTWKGETDEFEYLPRFGWTPEIDGDYFVWMLRSNRLQNHVDLLYGNPESLEVSIVLTDTEETWVQIEGFRPTEKVEFLKDNKHFIWFSEMDGFNHVYLYKNNGEFVRQVTKGEWEVTNFLGADLENNCVYVVTTAVSPIERHLYKLPLLSKSENIKMVKISNEKGVHRINMSKDFKYYIDSFSDHFTPAIVSLHSIDGKKIKVLEDNAGLAETIKEYNFPEKEFVTVPAADGTPLNAYMLKPTDFDPNKKYPLFIYTYGGITSQEVLDSWDGFFYLLHTYLVEELDVIVACVDNRGTGFRGKAFKNLLYKQSGTYDCEDQIAAAKKWGELPYIDESRMGIWGWSYGGYNTIMAMTKYGGQDIFKMGIAIAPGNDNRLYDTIYTERFMSTPQLNPDGYSNGNPQNFIGDISDDQKLLIIHGDMDDNVHYLGTVQLVSVLQKANKQFDFMFYPGGNHSLRGTGNPLVFVHLMTMLSNYVRDNL